MQICIHPSIHPSIHAFGPRWTPRRVLRLYFLADRVVETTSDMFKRPRKHDENATGWGGSHSPCGFVNLPKCSHYIPYKCVFGGLIKPLINTGHHATSSDLVVINPWKSIRGIGRNKRSNNFPKWLFHWRSKHNNVYFMDYIVWLMTKWIKMIDNWM
jgi:hypothetical protein